MASEPQQLATEVSTIAQTAFDTRETKPTEASGVLKFISQLVQVVDDALGEVMATLIDFKYVTPDDLRSGWPARTAALEKLLTGRSYRAAADICDRLRELERRYDQIVAPIVADVSDVANWSGVFTLLQQHEGGIVTLVDQTVVDLLAMCETATEADLPTIRSKATLRVEEIRAALSTLRAVRSSILGLSGSPGMLELIGGTAGRPVVAQ
jgi:hypothetical protein